MRLIAATIVASLAWTACSLAGQGGPVHIELGQSIRLKAGASAQTPDKSLQVGFEGVTTDSRCPKGAQCVWAGDAVARVWLQQGAGPRVARELHAGMGAAQAAEALGHVVRLIQLDPHPIIGKAVVQADYVATLTLSVGSKAVPDR